MPGTPKPREGAEMQQDVGGEQGLKSEANHHGDSANSENGIPIPKVETTPAAEFLPTADGDLSPNDSVMIGEQNTRYIEACMNADTARLPTDSG